MGLSLNQALNTASMGLQAAEQSINVIGNNLANANTTGFKANRADFADMFSRTYTYGALPSNTNGGTNPVQIGLGVRLTGVTTDFSQGTVKDGMSNTDMAIQGNGFFILSPNPNSTTTQYYSRDGVMKLTPDGTLVNSNGLYVMGFGVNDKFQIQTDQLTTLRIPVGEMKIAQATENVMLEGLLNATGESANQGTVLQSDALTDLSKSNPGSDSATLSVVEQPNIVLNGTQGIGESGSGNVEAGTYYYRFTYLDAEGNESDYSLPVEAIVAEGEDSIHLTGLPNATEEYSQLRIYRADAPDDPTESGTFYKVADIALSGDSTEYVDTLSSEEIQEVGEILNQEQLNGKYTYYVTYYDAYGNESTPSALSDSLTINGGVVALSDIPAADSDDNPDNWLGRNIYRCTANNQDSYYLVGSIDNMDASATFVDSVPDSELVENQELSFAGRGTAFASESTKLVDLGKMQADGTYTQCFEPGTLEFTPNKGEADLKTQTLEITAETTVAEYLNFIDQAFGLRTNATDEIPPDQGAIGKTVNNGMPGAEIIDGCITILGNTGTKNALDIDSNAFRMISSDGAITPFDLNFTEAQAANGESMSMTMEVYDSLGAAVDVKMTLVLQEKTDTETIYRWYADSSDNHPMSGNEIGLGTGLIRFDSEGKYIDSTNTTITVQRTDEASNSPMSFTFGLDMSAVAALSTNEASMTMQSQDGAGAGILVDFTIGTDGTINGIFSSNVVRPIGQVLLATFINNEGLVSVGDNLYGVGVASGAPTITVPGTGTAGTIKGNAIEQSNTNLSRELIDMILASTMYQANSKIISTSTTMMDALLRVVS